MNISGYAFKANETEIMSNYRKRFREIEHLYGSINIVKTPAYGKGEFSGVLKTDEEKNLSELDLALLADNGNLCFGGYCTISGDKFSGAYYTD